MKKRTFVGRVLAQVEADRLRAEGKDAVVVPGRRYPEYRVKIYRTPLTVSQK